MIRRPVTDPLFRERIKARIERLERAYKRAYHTWSVSVLYGPSTNVDARCRMTKLENRIRRLKGLL